MNRPTGVTIIGVLSIIGGILGICAGAVVLGLGGIIGMGGAAAAVTAGGADAAAVAGVGGLAIVTGLGSLVLSVIQLASGVGLLQLAPWAYRLTVIVSIINLIWAVITFLTGGGVPFVSIIVSGIVLWYMNQPEVRGAFNRGDKQLWAA